MNRAKELRMDITIGEEHLYGDHGGIGMAPICREGGIAWHLMSRTACERALAELKEKLAEAEK